MSVGQKVAIAVLSGPHAGLTVEFSQGTVRLGRDVGNDLTLAEDKAVSHSHALLLERDGQWIVQDAGSKNGVFIEREGVFERIGNEAPVALGQCWRLGRTTLRLESPRGGGAMEDLPSAVPEIEAESPLPGGEGPLDDGAAEPGLVLHIELDGEFLKHQILSSGALATRHSVRYCPDDVAELNGRLYNAAAMANCRPVKGGARATDEAMRCFEEVGGYVHDHLLPHSIQRRLSERAEDPVGAGTLFVVHDAALIRVPWELAFWEGRFLCRTFAMGRQVMLDDATSLASQPRREGPLRMLIVCNPTEDLVGVEEGAEALFERFRAEEARVAVDYVAGARVERLDLLARLAEADIVFYLGHAEHDARTPANSAWLLQGARVTCADFRSLPRTPRLVFANGCETGREASWSAMGDTRSCGYGLASSFLLGGVESYVGALWPIPVQGSTAFAGEFFTRLFEGYAVGECVRRARNAVCESYGPSAVLWAGYVLYGDPRRKFV